MKIIYNDIFLDHDTGDHPENKKRLEAFGHLESVDIQSGEQYLTLYHTPEYIDSIKKACSQPGKIDNDTVVSQNSYKAAIYAVGAVIEASQKGDFALVRPPGHHAFPDHSSGFCIFNNIGIAVQKLVNEGKKVLIMDIDSHLGDGTEKFFYESDKVMYLSFHEDAVFPGGGTVDDIGYEKGTGFTINIPLPFESGDDVYKTALETLLPITQQFVPDVIGISAGFDGHHEDPLLHLNLSTDLYYFIGKTLRDIFSDKTIFAALEGGYNVEFLPKCVQNLIAGINRENMPQSEGNTESMFLVVEEFDIKINKLKENLKPYWKI